MPRVKRGKTHVQKRKRLFKKAKGFKWGRKNTIRLAKTAVIKAGAHAYRGRKLKKRINRRTWQVQLNAAARQHGLTYSTLINTLKKNKIELDRKVLADLANQAPEAFGKLFEKVKSSKWLMATNDK